MDLDLHAPATPLAPVPGDLTIGSLSWWFWIKAGIGFTLGAVSVGAIAWLVWVSAFFALLRTLAASGV